MRLVDTSAWIEWLSGKPAGNAIRPHLPDAERWLVPTIVQLELAKWMRRTISPEDAERIVAFPTRCVVAPLDSRIAWAAAELCIGYRLATADAVIYATAVEYGADLLTCDAHFAELDHVLFVQKKAF